LLGTEFAALHPVVQIRDARFFEVARRVTTGGNKAGQQEQQE
jgi:hypothetical protein